MRFVRCALGLVAWVFFLSVSTKGRSFDCTGVDPSQGTELRAKLITSGLTRPVDVTSPPGDPSRVFVVDQKGRIRIVNITNDTLVGTPFLDIRSKVKYGGEMGLLGLVFHPDYATNGFFFVNYTRGVGANGQETVIARFNVSASNPDIADPNSQKILLTYSQPFANHKAGQLQFGPTDGYLYIATGDGGSGGDPNNNAQNPQSLLGKMLRIDVDSGSPYAIPSSNPFASSTDGVRDEIWALGLRNPWRFCFDPATADMYIADVGQDKWEEIDFQPGSSTGGINYQWKVLEATHSFSATSYGTGTRVPPILEYPHALATISGCSITGGVVYRGCSMPDLHGAYFFADYCNDWIRTLRYENGKVMELKDRTAELKIGLTDSSPLTALVAFGVDYHGEVYICDLAGADPAGEGGGKLYRVISAAPPSSVREFERGNVNGDSSFDISDPVNTLLFLFAGLTPAIQCMDAFDADDDGKVGLTDAIYSLNALFIGGRIPPAPGLGCGSDPTDDSLGCDVSSCR